jgi:glycosyltransferase involved in cell wall biosynthesis
MRIAYILHTYPAISQTFVLREVRELRRLGVDVDTYSVFRARREDLLAEADKDEAARTYALRPVPWLPLLAAQVHLLSRSPITYVRATRDALRGGTPGLHGLATSFAKLALAVLLWSRCRRRGVRHLHSHFAGTSVDIAALAVGVGNAVDTEGCAWTRSQSVHGPVELASLDTLHMRERMRDASLVIATSHFTRSQLLALLDRPEWEKVHMIRCGIDPRRFPVRPEPPVNGRIEILNVARLVGVKGHYILLDALATLRERGVEFHATVIGDGPERTALGLRVLQLDLDRHVTFAGAVGHDAIGEFFAAAHIFCLPSFAEGLPVSLMEAMASGIPVVTTRIMGTPELVEDGVNGLLVTPGLVDPLAGALGRLAVDHDLRAALGQAGSTTVRSEFDITELVGEVAALLTNVVSVTPKA